MIFDKAAGVVERYMPELKDVFQRGALFVFPRVAHEALPKTHTPSEIEWLEDRFFLPFSRMFVEDPATCVLLMDTEDDQRGMGGRRLYCDMQLVCMAQDREAAFDRPLTDAQRRLNNLAIANYDRDTLVFGFGVVEDVRVDPEAPEHKYMKKGTLDRIVIASARDGIYLDENAKGAVDAEEASGVLRNAVCALEELLVLNQPSQFVLETLPAKPRTNRPDRIRRSPDRSTYTLLTPGEIRKRIAFPSDASESTGRVVEPHARRRHWRHLTSERFTKKRGEWVQVPATWVGPHEVVKGAHRYKVRLDL